MTDLAFKMLSQMPRRAMPRRVLVMRLSARPDADDAADRRLRDRGDARALELISLNRSRRPCRGGVWNSPLKKR
jgi:hypothetical protein